ncbi:MULTISPECIES: hypothetical protein [Streptomyces]|uniref:Lipoprotein n=1 Tax=Streptomyces lonegramiae TaxID=3075524 RepID=A0ABU2XLU1_9ACTN|nr:hypothetical protein [Streptomyces sp. DSM 41529]MDT0546888.1 hypothetical protein [Streptomyces sp. DSM 41529]
MKACARRRFAARAWPAVVVSVVALGLAGCGGGGGDGDEVASARSGKRSSGGSKAGDGEVARYVEGQRKYAECLRGKGLDVPDPDAKGRIEYGDVRELKADPKFRAAQEKCSEYSLPVPEELEKETRPELSAKEIATKKRYSACMQENGAPDFPDTGDEGYFDEKMWDQTSAGAKRAIRTCAPIIGAPADPGKGKG